MYKIFNTVTNYIGENVDELKIKLCSSNSEQWLTIYRNSSEETKQHIINSINAGLDSVTIVPYYCDDLYRNNNNNLRFLFTYNDDKINFQNIKIKYDDYKEYINIFGTIDNDSFYLNNVINNVAIRGLEDVGIIITDTYNAKPSIYYGPNNVCIVESEIDNSKIMPTYLLPIRLVESDYKRYKNNKFVEVYFDDFVKAFNNKKDPLYIKSVDKKIYKLNEINNSLLTKFANLIDDTLYYYL